MCFNIRSLTAHCSTILWNGKLSKRCSITQLPHAGFPVTFLRKVLYSYIELEGFNGRIVETSVSFSTSIVRYVQKYAL